MSVNGPRPCVAIILIRDETFLVERRHADAKVAPSAVAIPGGHVEDGETHGEALRREAREELGIEVDAEQFVCTLVYDEDVYLEISYYWVPQWSGTPQCRAAAEVFWLPLSDMAQLDYEVDRKAVREYQKLCSTMGASS